MNFKQTRDNLADKIQTEFSGFSVTKSAYFKDNLDIQSKEIRVTVIPTVLVSYENGETDLAAKFSILCRGEHTDTDTDVNAEKSIQLAFNVLAFVAAKFNLIPVPGSEYISLAFYSEESIIYDVQFCLGYDID